MWEIDEPLSLPPGQPLSQTGSKAQSRQGSQPPSQHASFPPSRRPSRPPSPPSNKLPPINLPATSWSGQQSPLPPFRTFEPKTREERRAAQDKFAKEKTRIAQRNPKAEPPPDDVIMPSPNTSLFMDDYSRFTQRDAAAAEHERKQMMLQKKEAMYDRKRYENFLREARSWENNQAACERGEVIAAAKRERGQGGAKRNMSGTSYNILSLDYSNTADGEALKYRDAVARYKAHLRANNLYSKQQSSGFNILTGQPAWRPAEVKAPWEQLQPAQAEQAQ